MITITSSFMPSSLNTPLDGRAVVDSALQIPLIQNPFVGLPIYIKATQQIAVVTSLNEDEDTVENYKIIGSGNGVYLIEVTDNGDNTYTSSVTSQLIFNAYNNGELPVVRCGVLIYTLLTISSSTSSFIYQGYGFQHNLLCTNARWTGSEEIINTFVNTITGQGGVYTSAYNYTTLSSERENGKTVITVYNNEVYHLVKDDNNIMTFANVDVDNYKVKTFNIGIRTATYNEAGLITAEDRNKLDALIRVMEDGLFNVDLNMEVENNQESQGGGDGGASSAEVNTLKLQMARVINILGGLYDSTDNTGSSDGKVVLS